MKHELKMCECGEGTCDPLGVCSMCRSFEGLCQPPASYPVPRDWKALTLEQIFAPHELDYPTNPVFEPAADFDTDELSEQQWREMCWASICQHHMLPDGIEQRIKASVLPIEAAGPTSSGLAAHLTPVTDQALIEKVQRARNSVDTIREAEQRRAARLEAAMSVNGMWKGKADKPQDGLAYQLEARAIDADERMKKIVNTPNCRMQGGICACHSGGSYGGCAIERQSAGKPLFANDAQPAATSSIEEGLAQKDAELYGVGFLVNGLRVAPEWVTVIHPNTAVAALTKRIKYLETLVDAYGPKSYQYDIEHPNDGLNSTVPTRSDIASAVREVGRCGYEGSFEIADAVLALLKP
jgi:hypothetical protein